MANSEGRRCGGGRDKHTVPHVTLSMPFPREIPKFWRETLLVAFAHATEAVLEKTERIQTSVCHISTFMRTRSANLSHNDFRHVRRWSLSALQNISNDYGTKFMCFKWAKTSVQVSNWRSSCSDNYNIWIIVSWTSRHCEKRTKITAWERGWSLTCPCTWRCIQSWEFHCFDILVGSRFLKRRNHKKYGVTSWSCKFDSWYTKFPFSFSFNFIFWPLAFSSKSSDWITDSLAFVFLAWDLWISSDERPGQWFCRRRRCYWSDPVIIFFIIFSQW